MGARYVGYATGKEIQEVATCGGGDDPVDSGRSPPLSLYTSRRTSSPFGVPVRLSSVLFDVVGSREPASPGWDDREHDAHHVLGNDD